MDCSPTLLNSPCECRSIKRGLTAALAAILFFASSGALSAEGSADDQVPSRQDPLEAYLERLQLEDLQIVYLQQQLQSVPPAQRADVGRRLADLYADKLTRVADDSAAYEATLVEVRRLLKEVPAANTLSLKVMLQQAEYLRAEQLIGEWMEDRQSEPPRQEALRLLAETAPKLADYREEIAESIQRINQQLDETRLEKDIASLEDQLRQLQIVQFRADYYAGWSGYYLGVLSADATQRERVWKDSQLAFRTFLGLDLQEDLAALPGDWLDLSSVLQARGAAGLAMTLQALQEEAASQRMFEILAEASTPLVVQQSLPLWELLSQLNLNRVEPAVEHARGAIRAYQGKATREQTRYCVTLLRYAQRPPAGVSVPDEATWLALEGLVRLRQFTLIQELVQEYNIELATASGFYAMWIRGNLAFAAGEQSGDRQRYLEAAQALSDALLQPAAELDPVSGGHCQYQLGWAWFLAERYEEAADAFQRAALLLAASDQETAASAAWKRYECFRKLAEEEPRFLVMAMEALRELQANFPNHRLAQTAAYHLTKLQRSQVPLRESIASLESLEPGDANYLDARFELCLLYHQRWNQTLQEGADTATPAAELAEAVETFRRAAGGEDPQRLVQVTLLLADTGLRGKPQDLAYAEEQLQGVAGIAERLPAENRIAAEYHYQRFQLARLRGDEQEAEQEAQWLVDYAPRSAYVQSALVLLARNAERQLAAATGSDRDAVLDNAESIYQRLLNLYGSDSESLTENKNARVSLYRLANIAQQRDRPAEAARRFERLLAVDPQSETYLHGAARSWFAAGQFNKALPLWRRLAKGLQRGSDGWLEAKYHVIACLAKQDPTEAREVLQQFRLLYPAPQAGQWETPLQQLERQLGAASR